MGNDRLKADLVIRNAAQIVTCGPAGIVENGWLACADGKIAAVGAQADVAAAADLSAARVADASGKVVAPGFVDCHTHVVFGGSRSAEYAARLSSMSEADMTAAGIPFGLRATLEATREADEESLLYQAKARLAEMLRNGATTVESKSGYWLNTPGEMRMLALNERLNRSLPMDIVSTFLGAHAVPPEFSKAQYIDLLIKEMIPRASETQAVFCDVWCENGYYTAKESEAILRAGLEYGMKPRIHTDEFSYIGGSDVAAEVGAYSADHLNHTPPKMMRRLAEAGVVGVVLPLLDFTAGHERPFRPREMLEAGMTLALATNCCPAAWNCDMKLVMAMACRVHGMTPYEALEAATAGAAKALGLADGRDGGRGSLQPGKLADFQIWNTESYTDAVYKLGVNITERVFKEGKEVVNNGSGGGDHQPDYGYR
jgi:imidazolonepropionase